MIGNAEEIHEIAPARIDRAESSGNSCSIVLDEDSVQGVARRCGQKVEEEFDRFPRASCHTRCRSSEPGSGVDQGSVSLDVAAIQILVGEADVFVADGRGPGAGRKVSSAFRRIGHGRSKVVGGAGVPILKEAGIRSLSGDYHQVLGCPLFGRKPQVRKDKEYGIRRPPHRRHSRPVCIMNGGLDQYRSR